MNNIDGYFSPEPWLQDAPVTITPTEVAPEALPTAKKNLEVILCVGIPGSGKSTWAKSVVASDPHNWVRINNDDIRAMINGSQYSRETEKFVAATRMSMLREALKRNRNVIIDNLNITSDHWTQTVLECQAMNKDITISEKIFFVPLETAIERDSKREGTAKLGADIISSWWKKSGKTDLSRRVAKKLEVTRKCSKKEWTPMVQDPSLPKAVVFDNDGTISLLNGRNPYDASTSDKDLPHLHVIECLKLYHSAGYKVIFFSGREEKDRAPTERFYAQHFPEVKYELYMRPTGSMEKDVIIKERMFNQHIKGKYFLSAWVDDRKQICTWLYGIGAPLFRVGNPEADF